MNTQNAFIISSTIVCLCAGIVFGLFHYEYLIWQGKPLKPYDMPPLVQLHKKGTVFYRKDNAWFQEDISVNSNTIQEACHKTVQKWLKILQEEDRIPLYISLETTMIDSYTKTAYFSFNKSLFFIHQSTFQKALILASLSKTLLSLKTTLQCFTILINDCLINDYHIDFTEPFNIEYWANLY